MILFAFIFVSRILWRIFCSGGFVVIYCFSFCLFWKTFIAPSILYDSFAGESILGLKLFSFGAWNTSLHALLDFDEFTFVCYLFFCLTAFRILSLLCAFCFNDNMSWRKFYFGQVCLVSWRLPVPEWA
jgi:hypothetical protein